MRPEQLYLNTYDHMYTKIKNVYLHILEMFNSMVVLKISKKHVTIISKYYISSTSTEVLHVHFFKLKYTTSIGCTLSILFFQTKHLKSML